MKANNLNMYYEIHGKGFPLVMIMGLSANVYWWDPPFLEELARHFQVLIFDNRGVGRSDDPQVDFSIKTMAEDLAALMDAIDIRRSHILGISMGGMIAQEFVLNWPERVEKLVLCATNCGGAEQKLASDDALQTLMSFAQREHDQELVKEALPLLLSDDFITENPKWIEERTADILKIPTTPSSYGRQLGAIMNFYTFERLESITSPTLVLHGKKDILVPPENAEILAAKIPGAKLALFENSAHLIFSQETQMVTNAIIEFLR
ncbi:MAG: alpha/beta fold hydrolase [Candidatus Hodarchaeota archaeon]